MCGLLIVRGCMWSRVFMRFRAFACVYVRVRMCARALYESVSASVCMQPSGRGTGLLAWCRLRLSRGATHASVNAPGKTLLHVQYTHRSERDIEEGKGQNINEALFVSGRGTMVSWETYNAPGRRRGARHTAEY